MFACIQTHKPVICLFAKMMCTPYVTQTYYLPGLRAEKEITRERIVKYVEQIFGEKLSARERARLLPNEVTVLVLGMIWRDNVRDVSFSLELAVAVQ